MDLPSGTFWTAPSAQEDYTSQMRTVIEYYELVIAIIIKCLLYIAFSAISQHFIVFTTFNKVLRSVH